METQHTPPHAPAQPAASTWLPDLLAAVRQRRQLAVRVALGVAVFGVLLAIVLPAILSPTPVTGFVVGVVAILVALAVVVVADNADVVVRGARHARAAGARIVGTVARREDGIDPHGPDIANVADALFEDGVRRVVGVTPASRSLLETSDLAESVAVAAATAGRRTMFMDLTEAGSRGIAEGRAAHGVSEVARGAARFADVVTFDDELALARIGAGTDPTSALASLPTLLPKLPSDIEAVVVALPSDGDRELGALDPLDEVVVVVESDVTRRVDLVRTLAGAGVGSSRSVLLLEPLPSPEPTPTEPHDSAYAAAVRGDDPAGSEPLDLDLTESSEDVRVIHAGAKVDDGGTRSGGDDTVVLAPGQPDLPRVVERDDEDLTAIGAIESFGQRRGPDEDR